MEKYEGDIVEIIYYNEENGYTVAVLETHNDYLTIVGNMPDLKEEEHLIVEGTWTVNAKFGKQFSVKSYSFVLPQKKDDILRYLASGIVKGVGEATAKRLVETFGEDTFQVLQYQPHRIMEIEGIGEKKSEMIVKSFLEHQESRELMIFLQKYGIRPNTAMKIYKRFGNTASKLMRENPYVLCGEKIGIGFRTADEIAQKMGVERHSPYRVSAALLFVLGEASSNGHTYLPKDIWILRARELIGVEIQEIESIYRNLIFEGKIKTEITNQGEKVYSAPNYISEVEVAHQVYALQRVVSLNRELCKNTFLLYQSAS